MGSNGAPESDSRSAAVSAQPPTVSARRAGATRVVLLLFVLLVAIYHVDGSLTHVNDMVPNLSLPISLLNEGNLTFTPEEFPEAIGSLLALSHINQFSHVVMDGSPVTAPFGLNGIKAAALRMFGSEVLPHFR